MACDDFFKGNIAAGLAIGLGAVVLGPIVLPILAGAGKPMAKAAIKGGIALFEKGKETAAEFGEVFEDIVAEAKAELVEEAENVSTLTAAVGEEQGA